MIKMFNSKYIKITIFITICLSIYFIYNYISSNQNVVSDELISEQQESNNINPVTITNEIYVEVKGCVKNPGVYKMDKESRIFNLIEKAGGLLPNANLSDINQTQKLVDEYVLYISSNSETAVSSPSFIIDTNNMTNKTTQKNASMVNLNTATLEMLQTLPGIGETKAKNILSYREQNGGFNNINELLNVNGIGQSTFDKLKGYITI